MYLLLGWLLTRYELLGNEWHLESGSHDFAGFGFPLGFSPVACQQNPIKINCTSLVFLLRMGKEEREDKDNKTKGFHISVQIKLSEFKCKEETEHKDKRRGV
jgi:hypothetical protein